MSPEERALRTQADNTPGCYTHITVDVNVLRVVLDELDQQRARAAAAEQDLAGSRRPKPSRRIDLAGLLGDARERCAEDGA